MPIFLWKFRPPKGSTKRRSSLSQGCRPTLQTGSGNSYQRLATVYQKYSTLMHLMQQCAYFWMYRHTLVHTCISRAFPAFIAVRNGRGAT